MLMFLDRPDGKKKAYVRLTADHDALDVANKVALIHQPECMINSCFCRLASSKLSRFPRFLSSFACTCHIILHCMQYMPSPHEYDMLLFWYDRVLPGVNDIGTIAEHFVDTPVQYIFITMLCERFEVASRSLRSIQDAF